MATFNFNPCQVVHWQQQISNVIGAVELVGLTAGITIAINKS